jgi:hypothetical protein
MTRRRGLTASSYAGTSLQRGGEISMTDALMVALMVGFFVLAGLFVAWLDRV